ncbi:MAG: class I SAM-dependent methyltransferase [Gemmatimonadaceae bacterium]
MTDNAQFDGSIPEYYDRHLGPLLFDPFARDLAGRLRLPPAARVLEVACGTGILTRRVRLELPPGSVLIATDLNAPMLDFARNRAAIGKGVEWKQADAMELPFEDEEFDAVLCQFGVMFFTDQPKAMLQVLRCLKPGGRFLFNTWGPLKANPLAETAHDIVTQHFPENPPDFYRVPYGLHDTHRLRRLLVNAGFEDIDMEIVLKKARATSALHAAEGLIRGNPIIHAIRERDAAMEQPIVEALAALLSERFGDDPMRVTMEARVIGARRPGMVAPD